MSRTRANRTDKPFEPVQSFDAFYAAHRDEMVRALALTFGDDSLGADAADEAMVRAYERWDKVATMASPTGWIYRTGLNWGRSFLRRRRRSEYKNFLSSRPDLVVDTVADTDMHRALAALTDEHRAIVVLRFLLDQSVDEVAETLGIAPGTVKSRLHRALDKLRDRGELRLVDGDEVARRDAWVAPVNEGRRV